MRRFSLRTLFIACIATSVLIGYFREPLLSLLPWHENRPQLTLITSPRLMNDALTDHKAIIFAYVDWSASAVTAHKMVTDFTFKRQQNGTRTDVQFYMVDLSDQDPPPYIADWLSSDNRLRSLLSSGAGEVVWLRDGKLKQVCCIFTLPTGELSKETEIIFKDK